ncbi:MAG: M14 family metallopeptidase [Pyrinomonadaceae bacterium]|nr:M14 family metallopeptidase [Pyrinomonadaceae bacterium]
MPTPKSVLGFHPTDERTIADWEQIRDYFTKLDRASDKVAVREIGKTTLDKPMIVAFISSADNIKNLDRYRQISAKLADPRTIKDQSELDKLLKDGKTIVSISCSIHSNEIVASQMSMNLAYEMATATDAETKTILDNTILLLIPSSNPDGVQMVAEWYRKTMGTKSEGTAPPQLYHWYAGHDNNRDWFMLNLKETQAITKLYWQEWFPQFVYDVHQMGQNGARFVIPPFHDPPNPRIDPQIVRDVGLVGYKMAADLQAGGVEGVATNTTFDMWWHGGFRSAPYYHNSIGILSEAASADLMTPVNITKEQLRATRPARGLTSPLENSIAHPDVWEGGKWGPKEIANIEMIASRSLLSLAANYRHRYLKNFHDLGRANLARNEGEPQAYIIPAGQPRAETVSRFLEILKWQGIEIFEMTNELYLRMEKDKPDFHEMPLGSFIVFVNQPQKNNILSLFERQVYPNRINPNGEPDQPYDVAGWTLPLQMGVEAEAIWEIRDLDKYRNTLKPLATINQARAVMNLKPANEPFPKVPNPLKSNAKIGMYQGSMGSMDEGWTRLVFDNHQIKYASVSDADMRAGKLDYDVLVLPAIAENAIVRGLSADRYPAEFSGGIGTDGIANLKRFVENGGQLVCFDDSCELVIKEFGLPLKNVLSGVRRQDFYNPGSIVKLNVDTRHRLAKGTLEEMPVYFITSSAFEVGDTAKVTTIARYADRDALMSGWMLGEKLINGKAALVEAGHGKGKIVLFAFRPQHRGQTWATFPFMFNALEK